MYFEVHLNCVHLIFFATESLSFHLPPLPFISHLKFFSHCCSSLLCKIIFRMKIGDSTRQNVNPSCAIIWIEHWIAYPMQFHCICKFSILYELYIARTYEYGTSTGTVLTTMTYIESLDICTSRIKPFRSAHNTLNTIWLEKCTFYINFFIRSIPGQWMQM